MLRPHSLARVGRALLCALVPGLVAAIGCASAPEADEAPPDPVFATTRGDETRHWRYVPLVGSQTARPSAGDFARVHAGCASADSGGDDGGDELDRCMARRGFYRALCSDGLDNDGDGLADHPRDPGCAGPHAIVEDPACDDGVDNDGDGLVDWDGGGVAHPDPACAGAPARADESEPASGLRRLLPF